MAKGLKTQIFLWASPEEMTKFVRIQKFYKRKTSSDTIRFLIDDCYEKIFPQNYPCVDNQVEGAGNE